jgi:hypothetical protein
MTFLVGGCGDAGAGWFLIIQQLIIILISDLI